MSTATNYIPHNDNAFLNWVKFLIVFVKTNAEQWQIPATSWTNLDYKSRLRYISRASGGKEKKRAAQCGDRIADY